MDRLQKRQSAYLKARKEVLTSQEKKDYKARAKKKKRGWFLAALLLNFGILAVLKYTNCAIVNINALPALFGGGQLQLVDLLLPMGISFYTFQTVSYVIDVYRGKYPPQESLPR